MGLHYTGGVAFVILTGNEIAKDSMGRWNLSLAEVRCFSSYKQALIVSIVKVNFGCCFLTRVGNFFCR